MGSRKQHSALEVREIRTQMNTTRDDTVFDKQQGERRIFGIPLSMKLRQCVYT